MYIIKRESEVEINTTKEGIVKIPVIFSTCLLENTIDISLAYKLNLLSIQPSTTLIKNKYYISEYVTTLIKIPVTNVEKRTFSLDFKIVKHFSKSKDKLIIGRKFLEKNYIAISCVK